ncbi:MAG TPA: hypothetical protein PLM64_07875, partial [Flavobacterium sp.]|nr:hypothetical protein [Flavobacterium sp.]
MMVYLTTVSGSNQPGFYYWDNATTSWKGFGNGSGWSLTGNTGTTPGTNFVGTTDDKDLIFKRNNTLTGKLTPNNVAFGVGALQLNTTGSNNVAN